MKPRPINSISQENISTNNHSVDDESNMNTIDVIAELSVSEKVTDAMMQYLLKE